MTPSNPRIRQAGASKFEPLKLGQRQILVKVSKSRCGCGQSHNHSSSYCEGRPLAVCGTIICCGPQVTPWIVDLRVLGIPVARHRYTGSLAVLDFDQSHLLPSNITDDLALSLSHELVLAWLALARRASARKGERVLVVALSDQMTAAIVQVAKLLGTRPIAIAPNSDPQERARILEKTRISSDSAATGDSILFDSVPIIVGSALEADWELVTARGAPNSRMVVFDDYGNMSSWDQLMKIAASKGMAVFPISLTEQSADYREARRQAYGDLLEAIAKDRSPAFTTQMHSEVATARHRVQQKAEDDLAT